MARTKAQDPLQSIPRIYVECGIDIDDLAKNCPLDNGKHENGEATAERFLHNMPTELCWSVFDFLDLQTLTTLRRVNRQTRAAIDDMPHYKVVFNGAPQALRAYLSTESAQQVTIQAIARQVCSDKCSSCGPDTGRFGSLLYLLTCERLCYDCFETNPTYQPIWVSELEDTDGMSEDEISALPQLLLLRGNYHWKGVFEIGGAWMAYYPDPQTNFTHWQYEDEAPNWEDQSDFTSYHQYLRFAATVAIPWVDQKSENKSIMGFCCVDCHVKQGMRFDKSNLYYEHFTSYLRLSREQRQDFHSHKVFARRQDLEAHYERFHADIYMYSTGEISIRPAP